MERNERLQAAFYHLRMKGVLRSQKDLANALGATAPHISCALQGNEKYLTDNLLIRFQSKFNEFNLSWLMGGVGEMLNTPKKSDSVLTRIKQIVESSGLTAAAFAQKVGIDTSVFENKLSGEAEFDDEDLMQISKSLNIRIGWLLNGQGQVSLLPEKMRQQVAIDTYRAQMKNKESEEEQKGIPLIPFHAMAGALSGDCTSINEWDIESYFVIPAFRKSDFCIRVDGDSMEPRYCKGDIIACTRVPLTDLWFQWGKVYVIDTRQGALVKHIERGKDEDHIQLVSENPEYKPFEIPKSELFGVALVNGLIRVE